MTQFWRKVKEAVQGAAEDSAEALKEGATAVAERAPKVAAAVAEKSRDALKIADLKLQIRSLNIQAEKQLSELGGRVYEVLRQRGAPVADDPEARSLVEKVRDLEKKIGVAEKELEALRSKEGLAQAEEEPEPVPAPHTKPRKRSVAAKPASAKKPRRPSRSGETKKSAAGGRAAVPRKPPKGKTK